MTSTLRFNRVLVLYSSVGAGHARAAHAIVKALSASGAAGEIRHFDALNHTTRLFRSFYLKHYIRVLHHLPRFWDWFYDFTDNPRKMQGLRLWLDRINSGRLIREITEYNPDLIVSTHFFPPNVISWMKKKHMTACQQAIVVTDLDVHASWRSSNCDHYFVALEESREYLIATGIPPDGVSACGIPIDEVFSEQKDRAQMCARHGLDPDAATLLVSTGGAGVGKVEVLLEQLLKLRHPSQLIIICGRNAKLKQRMDSAVARLPHDRRVRPIVLGFTEHIDELMAAAQLVVGKPGGLTMAEALCRGLIHVIVDPIPGQEERNADHLLEEGAALRCNNLPTLAWKIDRLLDDPARLAAMRENVRRLARPNAANEIVAKLLTLNG